MKVAIVGATGETGRSVVHGLLNAADHFEITALVRVASLTKPAVKRLGDRGVRIVAADLQGPLDDLVKILHDIDVVISTIHYQSLTEEIALSTAAKAGGVQRYVPCFWATVAPRGVMQLRDAKQEILDHVQRLRLPYTVIDVGWWYQITLPRVPSGRFDYALAMAQNMFLGDGDVPSALTDISDVGLYAAKIISNPRTLNKKIFAYTESFTQNEVFRLVEKVTGEQPEAIKVSAAEIETKLAEVRQVSGGINQARAQYEYFNSWGIRGDNTPECARYLGYLVADELYPDLKGRTLESYIREVLSGHALSVYSA
ncbi:hypothetical protein BDW74DRAFT_185710 [Aspergillus multicolor]|uniref:uncharacterized protein n=1 Tax=Aspergillus multicolor TaxID=41759 RepID=UPI003CCE38CD